MHHPKRHKGPALAAFAFCLTVIITLALASTTWAAPGAQGTVPTPPGPTSVATPGGGGGGNDNGGNDNGGGGGGGNDNGGTDNGGSSGGTTDTGAATAVPGTGTVCAIGDTESQCSAGNVIVVIGAGAASAGSALTIEGSFGQPPCPASPVSHNFLNRCYRYTWIDSSAQPLSTVSGPVQYCIAYGPEQLAAVTNNPGTFLIGLAGTNGQWTLVKPNVDTAGGRVCATSDQLIRWSALFAPQASSSLLPTVGGEFNVWWLAPIAALGLFLWLGALKLRTRGNQ